MSNHPDGLLRTGRAYKAIPALWLLAMMFGAFLLYAPPAAKAQFDLDTPEELILSVQAGNYTLSGGILAYQYHERYYLPIIELSEAFSFYTESDLSRGFVSGWSMEEDNTYSINADRRELIIKGIRNTLSDSEILSSDMVGSDDLYVQQEVLSRVWPLAIAVNLPNLSVDVLVDEKMPFMQRIERKMKRKTLETAKAARNLATASKEHYAFQPNPYKIAGLPAVDIETENRYSRETGSVSHRTNISGTQDLLWATADYSTQYQYRNGESLPPETIRMRLSRAATPDQPLPLGLKLAEGGDTRVRHSPLIKNGTSGRGVFLTSSDRGRGGDFDVVTVEGVAPAGWEVEVYRNGELISFGSVDERGEYRFEDVPLTFGNNRVRIVLFGPQGQMREEIREYTFGANMLPPGDFSYSLGAVDTNKDFLRLRKKDESVTGLEGEAVSAEASYGVMRDLTVYGTATTLPTDYNDERRDYVSVGAGLSLPFGVAQVEAYKDITRDNNVDKKGSALDMRFITDIFGFKLNLRTALFKDFESPNSNFGDNRKEYEYDVSIQKQIRTKIGQLGFNLDADKIRQANDERIQSYSTRQTYSYGGYRVANSTTSSIRNNKLQTTTGQITASARFNKVRLEGTTSYNIFPHHFFQNVGLEAIYDPNDLVSLSFSLDHDLLTDNDTLDFRISRDFEKFIASLESQWSEGGDALFTLRASTSLGPYGQNGGYTINSQKMTSAIPVRANVFMDNDGDGLFSEGDEPVPDAGIRIGGRGVDDLTGENGALITLKGVAGQETDIELDQGTLFDPYFKPSVDGYKTVLRSGSMPVFNFPVIQTGAIDGTVSREDGSPIPGMRLELVNDKSEVVMTTESAFDGFYTFEYVKPGTYTVRADPTYGVNVPPQTIAVASEELFASGIDLQLLEQAVEAEAADEAVEEDGEVAQPHHASGTVQPAPISSNDGFSVIVQRVRIGEHPDGIRLVLDLSGPGTYAVNALDGGGVVQVDLPGANWEASKEWSSKTNPVLGAYRIEPLESGGIRLILQGRDKMAPGSYGILEPDGEKGYRFIINLEKK